MTPVFKINGIDYSRYLKMKTGLAWSRENTNSKDAGRDSAQVMHTDVTSHQRKLSIKLNHMPFNEVQRLEADLESGDAGVKVTYPDIRDGVVTRLFYNTSIKCAIERFTEDGVIVDDIQFDLTSVKEDLVNA